MSTAIERIRCRAQLRNLPSPELARAIRKNAGLTQGDVAEALGVHLITVLHWEKGHNRPRGKNALAYGRLLQALQRDAL